MSRIQIQKGGFSWYLVLAKRGCERMAKENLERQGFEVYLPMHAPEPARPKPGKPVAPTPRPFLPGYLFVAADIHASDWRRIYGTYGVRSIYTTGAGLDARPRALPNRWIEDLQCREVNGLIRLAEAPEGPALERGAAIQYRGMRSLPLDGVFLERVDGKRVAILISLLGSDSRRVEVDAAQVRQRNT